MPDERSSALARREPDHPDDGGIDPRLAAALVAAIVDYPSFDTACASCGVTSKNVRSLLQRGVQAGAPPSLKAFSKAMAREDAENARTHQEVYQRLLATGNAAAARVVGATIQSRWPTNEGDSIMAILTSGKQSANLRARLERPGAALTGLLATMLRSPTPEWAALLEAAGYSRAIKAPEPEDEPDQEPAPAPEEEPGGDGI